MKLNRVYIQTYKNLNNIDVDFSQCEGVAVITGRNGSGKSNFLEALSLIMKSYIGYDDVRSQRLFFKADFESGGKYFQIEQMPSENRIQVTNTCRCGVPHQQVIAMYCGEFMRLLECGYRKDEGWFSPPDLTAVSAEDFPVALLTILMENEGVLSETLDLISAEAKCESVSFRLVGQSAIDPECGPVDELEDILWKLEKIAPREDDIREIPFVDFVKLIKLGQDVSSRTFYWALSQLLLKASPQHLEDVNVSFVMPNETRFSSDDLSEGEKRIIMLRAVCDFLAEDDALLLLDEPDAYINDTRKLDLYDLIVKSAKRGITIIMTTHSPVLIDHVPVQQLFVFQKENGVVKIHKGDEFNPLFTLTDTRMSIFSIKPILMVEGKSDVYIIERAIAALGRLSPDKYGDFCLRHEFDIYFMAGAQYAIEQLKLFEKQFPKRRIELIFDNDNGGRKGFSDAKKMTLRNANIRVHLLPSPNGEIVDCGIEDYFSKKYLNQRISDYLSSPNYKSFMSLPNLKEVLKQELAGKGSIVPCDEEFTYFRPVVDLLMSLREKH